MESSVSCNFNDYGWQSLGCFDRVVHKWLNISINSSDYSADVDDSVCGPVGAGGFNGFFSEALCYQSNESGYNDRNRVDFQNDPNGLWGRVWLIGWFGYMG
ncbi:hypothetical protein Hanom_Chr13g01184341 [Helianthus anomalus]